MEVRFKKSKMAKACSSDAEARKKWGDPMARRLQQRLMELVAADTLADISHLPPARYHEEIGDRAGQISVDLVHPFRLIFEPDHDPVPRKPDGGLDRGSVTRVLVLEVCDPH